MPLTPRQSRFVSEYLVDMNATNAAVCAGYSPKTAKSQGSRLLTNVDLKKEISRLQLQDEYRLKVDREAVLLKLDSAIKLAEKNGEPRAMILAAAEINKMMGFYR